MFQIRILGNVLPDLATEFNHFFLILSDNGSLWGTFFLPVPQNELVSFVDFPPARRVFAANFSGEIIVYRYEPILIRSQCCYVFLANQTSSVVEGKSSSFFLAVFFSNCF